MRTGPFTYALAGCLLAAACGKVSSGDDGGDGDNQLPVATPAELSTWMSTPIAGQLEGEDPDGEPLTFAVADPPAGGTLELEEDGAFRYTPARGTSGDDSFTFVVDDSTDVSAEATVAISILPLTDGTPDPAFGDGGVVTSNLGDDDVLTGVVAMPDGRIAVSGDSGGEWAVVAGYSVRGAVLSPWGEGGSGNTMLNLGEYDAFGDLVQQADGRLVSVGQTQTGPNRDVVLLGLTNDMGYLDSSFADGGVVVTNVVADDADVAEAVALLPDGRLLVAGYASNGSNQDFLVMRYTADGELDDTFGTGGSTLVNFGGYERVADLAVDGTGNIVLVGTKGNDMAIARVSAQGQIDLGFGDEGKVLLDRGEIEEAVAVIIGPDGAIYVGGTAQDGGVRSMAVAKLTPAGELDAGFGEDGWGVAGSASGETFAHDMVLLPNQTLLLVGGWLEDDVTQAAAARIDLSGRMDPLFGDAGFYRQVIGSGGEDVLHAAALQEDGMVVAAGSSMNADLDALVVRLGW
ncbi:MAG TPA: Ig-like domain-containing protein [Kofleriaceae bacterium]|nr:Ig-like domain-containing protein [Kofleriaceae bacterium]